METKFVKFLKNHPQFAHEEGDVAELEKSWAEKTIEAGIAAAPSEAEIAKAKAAAAPRTPEDKAPKGQTR